MMHETCAELLRYPLIHLMQHNIRKGYVVFMTTTGAMWWHTDCLPGFSSEEAAVGLGGTAAAAAAAAAFFAAAPPPAAIVAKSSFGDQPFPPPPHHCK
jgi:phage tail tape-measure protein